MIGDLPSHEIVLALRRRRRVALWDEDCVLRRPEGCEHCWPCRKAAAERERAERRREFR